MTKQKTTITKNLALVIEDDESLAFMFNKALKMAGFNAETILDGITAQQRIAEEKPKVVVLDLRLPGIGGDQLLDQIQADKRLKNTQVIIATADAAMADSLNNERAIVLIKPVSFTQLSTLAARFRPATRRKQP
ncbi:MAG: response regulator [Anaerolineae bacterium]|nr:response regulator [Anaerolineae bacterium]